MKPSLLVPTALLLASLAGCSSGTSNSAPINPTPPIIPVITSVDSSVNFKITNSNSALLLGIDSATQTAGANAIQSADTASSAQLWHFVPATSGQYWIVNSNSGQLLGVAAASTLAGANAIQYSDNGTSDHLWTLAGVNGQFKFKNVNSGLVLGITSGAKASGAIADQAADDGSADHLWTLTSAGAAYPNPGTVSGNTAPVADPSMLKQNGAYFLYATGGPIQVRTSPDRTAFSPANLVYAFPALPAWTAPYNTVDLWAPDVTAHNGLDYMFYAASTFGTANSGIGLATSPTGAAGSWTDSGAPILTSSTCSGINSIDPGLVVDPAGNWWLSYGSYFGGITMVQLNPLTGKLLSPNPTCYPLAKRLQGTAIEGTYIYPHGGFYYLFASLETCCQGIKSDYHIVVGRASSPTGPYVDRGGVPMLQGGGTVLLATHGTIIGPGGESLFPDADGDVLVYHYNDASNNGITTLGINLIGWTSDGWPYVH